MSGHSDKGIERINKHHGTLHAPCKPSLPTHLLWPSLQSGRAPQYLSYSKFIFPRMPGFSGNQQGSIRPSVHLILSGRAAIVRLAPLSFSALCPSCTLRVVLFRLCVSWSSAKVQEMIMILATFETVDGEPWAKFRSGYSRCELIPYFLITRALAVSHLEMHVFLI